MNYSFEKPTDLKSGGHCKWRRSVWRVCFGLTFWCLVVCLNEPYLQERRIDCIIHQGNKVGRWWMVKWAVWAVIQCKLFDANGVVRCREFVCFGFTLESLVVCRNYQCVQGRRRGCIIHTHTHTHTKSRTVMDTYVGSVSSRLVSIDKLWRLLTPLCHVLPTDQSTTCCCFLWFFCWERTCDQCWNVDFANTFCHLKCRNNHQHDCGHLKKEEEEEELFDLCWQCWNEWQSWNICTTTGSTPVLWNWDGV